MNPRTHKNEPQHADGAILTTITTAIKDAGSRDAAVQAMMDRLPSDHRRRQPIIEEAMRCVRHLYG